MYTRLVFWNIRSILKLKPWPIIVQKYFATTTQIIFGKKTDMHTIWYISKWDGFYCFRRDKLMYFWRSRRCWNCRVVKGNSVYYTRGIFNWRKSKIEYITKSQYRSLLMQIVGTCGIDFYFKSVLATQQTFAEIKSYQRAFMCCVEKIKVWVIFGLLVKRKNEFNLYFF